MTRLSSERSVPQMAQDLCLFRNEFNFGPHRLVRVAVTCDRVTRLATTLVVSG
jgi:hypothetical protein